MSIDHPLSVAHWPGLAQGSGQGNRTSKLGQDPGQEAVTPGGSPELLRQRAFRCFFANEVERHVAQDGKVLWTVVSTISRSVFVHGDVQAPMQAVLHPQCERTTSPNRSGTIAILSG
jgi:hypothetical protein